MTRKDIAQAMGRAQVAGPAAVRCSLVLVDELLAIKAAEAPTLYDAIQIAHHREALNQLRHEVLVLLWGGWDD